MVDMSYGQLSGFQLSTTSPPIAATQMSSTVTSVTSPRACCENGRPIMTDPHTGQTICSCQYGNALLNYSRVQGLPEGVYGASAAAYAAGAAQGYVPLVSEGSAFYTPLGKPAFDMKDGSAEAWRTLAAQSGGCFPYDPTMAIYPYGTGYGGLDLNARRKNATRETTNTLKAWLYEHRKNPYPTKGEKIMLAIITKMTLTQVSTWFANARRRLKKENKMTWSPRNRSEDGDGDMDDNDDDMDEHNKENANDSSNSHDSTLNLSLEDTNDIKRQSANITRERIINVDADDSEHSDISDDSDHDHSIHDTSGSRVNDPKDSNIHSPGSNFSESGSSHAESSKSPRLPGEMTSPSTSNSETDSQTRPKIWSVSDFLGNSNTNSNKECSSSKSSGTHAIVCSRQTNGPPFLNMQQHAGHSVRNGQFPMGIGGYPLSLAHTTLSYPYTLTSSTASKSELSLHHAAALRASEQALKEGLIEKASRIQNGIFSPGREIDGLKVGGKIML